MVCVPAVAGLAWDVSHHLGACHRHTSVVLRRGVKKSRIGGAQHEKTKSKKAPVSADCIGCVARPSLSHRHSMASYRQPRDGRFSLLWSSEGSHCSSRHDESRGPKGRPRDLGMKPPRMEAWHKVISAVGSDRDNPSRQSPSNLHRNCSSLDIWGRPCRDQDRRFRREQTLSLTIEMEYEYIILHSAPRSYPQPNPANQQGSR